MKLNTRRDPDPWLINPAAEKLPLAGQLHGISNTTGIDTRQLRIVRVEIGRKLAGQIISQRVIPVPSSSDVIDR